MVKERIVYLIIFIFIILNFLNSVNGRNPFKPVSKIEKKEPILVAVLISEENRIALIKYLDKNFIVTKNDKINQIFKIEEIFFDKVKLINFLNSEEKIITLDI